VADWTDIVAIAAGDFHTVGLRSDGTVVLAGYTAELYGDEVSDWTDIFAIAAGAAHVTGLRADGTVVAAGYNEDGQCDVETWDGIMMYGVR
jgi:alpha-tubulin suppressor-like RCC1 family protein